MAPKSDFLYSGIDFLICNEKARDLAAEPLEMSGEFLPIRVEGESGKYWIYNVTNTINVFDSKKTVWRKFGPEPDARMIEKPAFIASRFGEESIFKIAEDRGTLMYCVERTGDPDDGEFKAVVEQNGLTRIEFKLVWTDEKRSRKK